MKTLQLPRIRWVTASILENSKAPLHPLPYEICKILKFPFFIFYKQIMCFTKEEYVKIPHQNALNRK